MKALFSEKVINQIEKDVGCKIKMEEKFIIVSGKDRLILRKGVDAVHKIKEEADKKGPSSSQASRSRSPERRSPVSSRMVRSDSQRSNHSPQNASQLHHRYGRQEKVVDDRGHDGFHKIARGSSQGRKPKSLSLRQVEHNLPFSLILVSYFSLLHVTLAIKFFEYELHRLVLMLS